MDSKIASDERINFSDRLKSALTAAHVAVKPGDFVRAFNARADGAAVTHHAARKWLAGEAIPTQEKILILANWLGVHAAWLRFGDPENGNVAAAAIPESLLSSAHLELINDIISLPDAKQRIVRDIVDAFVYYHRSDHLRSGKARAHR